MKAKRIMAGSVLFLIMTASILFLVINSPLKAQEKNSDEGVSNKFDQILAGQKEILQEINSIKEQLNRIEQQTNKL